MSRIKTSPIWSESKEEFQKLLDSSKSICDVLRKLGLREFSGNHRTIKKRIEKEKLCLVKLKQNRAVFFKNHFNNLKNRKTAPLSKILTENSSYSGNHLKHRLIKQNILEYKCSNCGITEWSGKHISLQLDHKNGNNTDNRIENLRLLCPNCHSQTPTYAGKRLKKRKKCKCGKEITKKATYCVSCSNSDPKLHPLKFIISKKDLENLVKTHPMTYIAKKFKVSDVSIKNRCISLGIDLPNRRGYWQKLRAKT